MILKTVKTIEEIKRPVFKDISDISEKVREIIALVRKNGDEAIKDFTRRFDKVILDNFQVGPGEIKSAYEKISPETLAAFKRTKEQLERFHNEQLSKEISVEVSPGVICQRQTRAISRIGLYVPGGTAPLPSTVFMLGVPAELAGCSQKILCSPPRENGSIDPNIIVAADLCGIKMIFKLGGAQAIAAMAYGTETVPKVDKIFGPGNSWVTQAKLLVSLDPEGATIDMPAGPSEVIVIADDMADPKFITADLLSQAEHGPDSQVVLISTNQITIDFVQEELARQLEMLPRMEIAKISLENSFFLKVESIEAALEAANTYAPEHLILQIKNPREWIQKIENAGSVFLGPWSPAAVGDYASGTNHVLPTYGFAKSLSGLSVESFMKQITFQELSPEGLADIGPVVETMAELEGLDAHKRSVSLRLEKIRKELL